MNYEKEIISVLTCATFGTIKQATKYISDKQIIRATRTTYKAYKGKPDRGNIEINLTIGKPNFAEREFIKKLKKAKEPFPVKKIQFKHFAQPQKTGSK